jgi:hypothetical protein
MGHALMHSRFAKIPQQTKYAHGRHDVSSCFDAWVTGGVDAARPAGAPIPWRIRVNVHALCADVIAAEP